MNNYLGSVIRAAKAAPVVQVPTQHPMIAALQAAAARFDARTDDFAAGKSTICRDIAAKLDRFGDFASDKQADFARKLVEWSQPRVANSAAPVVTVPALIDVMQRFAVVRLGNLRVSRENGESRCWLRWADVCVGKIEGAEVKLFARRVADSGTTEAHILDVLREFNASPLDTAMRYGRASGKCCMCGRDLTDAESVAAGIGLICAGKI